LLGSRVSAATAFPSLTKSIARLLRWLSARFSGVCVPNSIPNETAYLMVIWPDPAWRHPPRTKAGTSRKNEGP
jgi:hypothetical protein